MGWKQGKWKLKFKDSKDQWLVVLAVGLIFLILAFPMGKKNKNTDTKTSWNQMSAGMWTSNYGEQEENLAAKNDSLSENNVGLTNGLNSSNTENLESWKVDSVEGTSKTVLSYEQQLEARLKELLSHVDGVGEVEVMIVLKSSEEKVWRVDKNTSYSSTQETDSNGGTRDIRSQEVSEGTILSGQSGLEGPLLEKELRPEISGVVVTATGGGSPTVQAEISAAVEALFDVPSHKIKVLKRVE
ncbi:MAG: stage III sporulation protein AG [Hungatella sp.]|nr:stage III sporulation protein AG [Hungatella sp.]